MRGPSRLIHALAGASMALMLSREAHAIEQCEQSHFCDSLISGIFQDFI
jgi:hypothetical protein